LIGDGLSHLVMLEHAERYASDPGCCQFNFMGRRYCCVFDSKLAKSVLKDVHGKGSIHQALTPGTALNTFSLDSNEEWLKRRTLFRHAFSSTVLKHFEYIVKDIVEKMCNDLDKAAESGDIVLLDEHFQKLAINVICEVAFQYKLEGKFSSANEKVSKSFELVQKLVQYPKILLRLPSWMLYSIGLQSLGQYKAIHEFMDELAIDIFENICTLEENKELKENSLAKAIYHFSQSDGVPESDVKSEIRLMFIAGFETTGLPPPLLLIKIALFIIHHSSVSSYLKLLFLFYCCKSKPTANCSRSH